MRKISIISILLLSVAFSISISTTGSNPQVVKDFMEFIIHSQDKYVITDGVKKLLDNPNKELSILSIWYSMAKKTSVNLYSYIIYEQIKNGKEIISYNIARKDNYTYCFSKMLFLTDYSASILYDKNKQQPVYIFVISLTIYSKAYMLLFTETNDKKLVLYGIIYSDLDTDISKFYN